MHTYIHTYIYTYIHLYVMRVLCACVREREREREDEGILLRQILEKDSWHSKTASRIESAPPNAPKDHARPLMLPITVCGVLFGKMLACLKCKYVGMCRIGGCSWTVTQYWVSSVCMQKIPSPRQDQQVREQHTPNPQAFPKKKSSI